MVEAGRRGGRGGRGRIAVADAFDSMTTTRSYRDARSPDEALEELRRCAGSQFDPAIVEAFLSLHAAGSVPLGGVPPRSR